MWKQGLSLFVGGLLCCVCSLAYAQDKVPVDQQAVQGDRVKYVKQSPGEGQEPKAVDEYSREPSKTSVKAKPERNTLRNVGLWSGAGAMFVAAPLSIKALHPELSLSEALVVSASSTGGTLAMGVGVVGLGAGTVFLVFAPLVGIFSDSGMADMILMGAVSAGVGLGLVLLSPLIFNLGVESVDSRLGGQPPGRVGVSFGAMAGGFVGGISTWALVEDMKASPVAKGALIFSAALFMSNLTYGLLRLIDKPDEAATVMMATPLMRF